MFKKKDKIGKLKIAESMRNLWSKVSVQVDGKGGSRLTQRD